MKFNCGNVLRDIEKYSDFFFNLIFADPPYGLSTKWEIDRITGKYIVKGRAQDFMGKWDSLSGDEWEWFMSEAFRTLKHGGFLVLYAVERQTGPIKYYATMAGFETLQSVYWFQGQGFPKTSDAGTMLKKNGAQKKVAKRWDGYKYSIAPLKPAVEEILVFRKPCKTRSPLRDLLAWEKGDETISPAVINIEAGRIGSDSISSNEGRFPAHLILSHGEGCVYTGAKKKNGKAGGYSYTEKEYKVKGFVKNCKPKAPSNYGGESVDEWQCVEGCPVGLLNKQSGVRSAKRGQDSTGNAIFGSEIKTAQAKTPNDTGGASRYFQTFAFEVLDRFCYNSKAAKVEKNAGLDNVKAQTVKDGRKSKIDNPFQRGESKRHNPHPTVKPLALGKYFMSMFCLPRECNQTVYNPFSGSGSEIIALIKAGFDEKNIYACEGVKEYHSIAKKRIAYWKKKEIKG